MVTGVGTRVCHQHNFSLMGWLPEIGRTFGSLYIVLPSLPSATGFVAGSMSGGKAATDSQGNGQNTRWLSIG